MSAIDQIFHDLRARRRKAFIPFLTAGDPDLTTTGTLIERLAEHRCSICEVGIPYSDPIADGPVIQASYTRALDKQIRLNRIFEMIAQVTPKLEMAVVTMVSYAIVYRHGLQRYVDEACAAGVAGLIVPDLLIEEADGLSEICRQADVSLIQLVTPTTPRARAIRIANTSSGFIYYVSVTGITGERQELPADVVDQVSWLREQTKLPICIGFGISRPEHVKMLSPVADGVIVGSALVRWLEKFDNLPSEQVIDGMLQLVDELTAALGE